MSYYSRICCVVTTLTTFALSLATFCLGADAPASLGEILEVLVDTTRLMNELTMLHDFDGDGVPEVFINSWNRKDPVVAWKMVKSKDGKPTAKEIVLGDRGGGHGFAFGDINSDGREDTLIESGWYERPDGEVFAKPWKSHREAALPHPSAPSVIVDLTGDGRNDLAVSGKTGTWMLINEGI